MANQEADAPVAVTESPDQRPGDADRFEAAYHAQSARGLAYLARRCSPVVAADLAAETFTVAWRRVDALPEGDGQRAWLIGVARNVLLNHNRSEMRRLRLVDRMGAELATELASASRDPHLSDRTAGEDGQIEVAIGALESGDRELLTLMAWDGLERDELAVVLGCSRDTMRVRIHRARARLRAALDDSTPNKGQLQRIEHTSGSGPALDETAP